MYFLKINCPRTILITVEAPVYLIKSSRWPCLQDAFALYRFVLFKRNITDRKSYVSRANTIFIFKRGEGIWYLTRAYGQCDRYYIDRSLTSRLSFREIK